MLCAIEFQIRNNILCQVFIKPVQSDFGGVCETKEFELLNFLKRIVEKVDRRVCQTILLERDFESVRFVMIERHITSA